MRGALLATVLWLITACGGGKPPDPPSGAVDPRTVPAAAIVGSAPDAEPPAGSCRGAECAKDDGIDTLALGGGSSSTEEPATVTDEKMMVTREHCDALGRKFSQLTVAQGERGGGAIRGEAAKVGKQFAAGCKTDLVGQSVERREYECMLEAASTDDLLACKPR